MDLHLWECLRNCMAPLYSSSNYFGKITSRNTEKSSMKIHQFEVAYQWTTSCSVEGGQNIRNGIVCKWHSGKCISTRLIVPFATASFRTGVTSGKKRITCVYYIKSEHSSTLCDVVTDSHKPLKTLSWRRTYICLLIA